MNLYETLQQCPLCAGGSIEKDDFATQWLGLKGAHAVSSCNTCRFKFMNPRPSLESYLEAYSTSQGALLEAYPFTNEYYANEDESRLAEYRRKLDRLTTLGVKGKLLELGSCTGVFLNEARTYGFEVVGIEPSEDNCKKALESYGLELICGNVEDQEFDLASFDVVFSSHVFEHILAPTNVAKLLCSWLKPGGIHMLEVPNQFDNFSMRKKRMLSKSFSMDTSFMSIHHTGFFSPATLKVLAIETGCSVEKINNIYYGDSSNLLLHPFAAIRRLLDIFYGSSAIELIARKN